MNKESTKISDIFTEDINKLAEHLNIVIEAHNKQLDEIERLKEANKILEENWKHYMMICGKASEYIKENEFYLDYKTGACIKGVIPLLNILQNRSDDNE